MPSVYHSNLVNQVLRNGFFEDPVSHERVTFDQIENDSKFYNSHATYQCAVNTFESAKRRLRTAEDPNAIWCD